MFAALSMVSVMASANDVVSTSSDAQHSAQVQQYNQHKGLDVAKVVSVTNAQDPQKTDGLVKTTMVYLDGAGVSHNLEYTTMGYGRQNG
jgi:hypothetical protein